MSENIRLKKNQQLNLLDGRQITVTGKLGEGGQGIVYRVRIDGTDTEKALKWYFMNNFKDPHFFYNHLKENISNGSPSPAFVWPEQLTTWKNDEPFGYIMEIFPHGYESFSKFLMSKVSFESLTAMVDAALNIVVAFRDLHNKGYNYQDLNDGNFSINPKTGQVLICDNDNVMCQGESSGVLGKRRYMAPEVVRGDKMPDKITDRFSLAVILFMLLVGDHPLEGAKTNVPALTDKYERKFFGTEPLYIFDENDKSNRPISGLHNNAVTLWNFFPSFIKDAFNRSFSQESLLEGKDRLLEQEWINVLVRLKTSIVKCPHCNSEMFIESDRVIRCQDDGCHKFVKPNGYLKFPKRTNNDVIAPIFDGVKLYNYHMDSASNDFDNEAAVIISKPGKFGLKNETDSDWTINAPDGSSAVKKPGSVVVLGANSTITFSKDTVAKVISNA